MILEAAPLIRRLLSLSLPGVSLLYDSIATTIQLQEEGSILSVLINKNIYALLSKAFFRQHCSSDIAHGTA